MSTLLTGIISGFIRSCVDVPEISREWIPPKRALFYLGALLIYPVALIVAMAVVVTVVLVAYPLSYLYGTRN